MSFISRVRWHYRQQGVSGLIRTLAASPGRVAALFESLPSHFYDLETPIYREDIVTFVRPLVDADDERIIGIWRELDDESVLGGLENKFTTSGERPNALHSNWRELLYVLVRLRQPETVVETGVFDGLGSAYILAALEQNGSGTLHSIDIGNTERMPPDGGEAVGWAVTDILRGRWDLHIGDARKLLPEVVADTSPEMFVHDSLHTPEQMEFEYQTATDAMAPGGLLVSDNVRFNDVFWEFASDRLENRVFWKNTTCAEKPDGEVVEEDRLGAGVVSES